MAILPCVRAFILAILCGNPILKGALVTTLNAMIATLDLEITKLTATLGRLNIFNKILGAQINLIAGLFDGAKAQLNLILGPLSAAGNCITISNIMKQLQEVLGGKKFRGFQRKLASFTRATNLSTHISNLIEIKKKLKKDAEEFIEAIADLCP